MKKNNLNIILIISFLLFKLNIVAQVVYVSPNDTNKVIYILEGAIKNENNYRELPPFDFKNNNIADGTLIISKKSIRNKKNFYAMGNFIMGLRTGRFEYLSYKGRPQIIYNFKKGKLNGIYQAYFLDKLIDEGYYKDGKRNGYFIRHDQSSGTILSIENYENDSLKNWVKYYPSTGVPAQKGWGEKSYLNGECIKYDTIGQIVQCGIYKNGLLIEFKEFYPNSKYLKTHSIGDFKICDFNYNYLFYCDIKLENGVKTYYKENGDIIKKDKFLNGILE